MADYGDHRDVEVLQQCVAKLEGLLRRWLDLGQGRTTSLRHLSIYDQVWDPLFQETTRALGVGGRRRESADDRGRHPSGLPDHL